MAVIVKYVVVRNGVEKMTFTTKKEADAYDKMLDVADNLFEFIETSEIEIDEKQLEDLSLFLSQNKDAVMSILKGSPPKAPKPAKTDAEKAGETEEKEPEKAKPDNPGPEAKQKENKKK